MAEPLKPCPKCGGGHIGVRITHVSEDCVAAYVHCKGCGFIGGESEDAYADIPTAEAAWNATATEHATKPESE